MNEKLEIIQKGTVNAEVLSRDFLGGTEEIHKKSPS
jgi:hypothetical protein